MSRVGLTSHEYEILTVEKKVLGIDLAPDLDTGETLTANSAAASLVDLATGSPVTDPLSGAAQISGTKVLQTIDGTKLVAGRYYLLTFSATGSSNMVHGGAVYVKAVGP